MSLYRVKTDYNKSFSNPLKVKKGEMLNITDKKSKSKGWIYCMSKNGTSGWVPQQYLLKLRDSGKMLYDYDSTELSVIQNERVNVLKEIAGWCFCINDKMERGWLPQENLEPLDR